MAVWSGVKVFCATRHSERAVLGETITEWLVKNPDIEVVDRVVTQSSDSEFHCISITLFYKDKVANEQVSGERGRGGTTVEATSRKMASSRG